MTNGRACAVSTLLRVGWLSRPPAPVQSALLGAARVRRCAAGEVLFAVGDPPGGLHGLEAGCLAVESARTDSEPRKNLLPHPGAWIGEGPLVGLETRMIGAWATRPATVRLIQIAAFRRVAARAPGLWRDRARLALEDHARTIGTAQDLRRQRLAALLLEMEREGLPSLHRAGVEILDRDRLPRERETWGRPGSPGGAVGNLPGIAACAGRSRQILDEQCSRTDRLLSDPGATLRLKTSDGETWIRFPRFGPIAALLFPTAAAATAQVDRPNIPVIIGDDAGWHDASADNMGAMGCRTPNIDRIAAEGMMVTDAYAQQSCTAGRAAFVTGPSPKRTGLMKIGMPGDPIGLQPEDPTLAARLKPLGHATGQVGGNHLGDRDEHLPPNHGFDEFFGNLCHLNAEEEPENPADPAFRDAWGPRGVLRVTAGGEIEDTGPLTREWTKTVDEEFLAATLDFIERNEAHGTTWFAWFNTTRMHIFTHQRDDARGATGLGIHADGMVAHDGHVGRLPAKLDELGATDDTIVLCTTDSGAETFSWPDGGTSPFRGERATTWEGGLRAPMMARWPGRIAPGQMNNEIMSLGDWSPTLTAAAGVADIRERLLEGHAAGGRTSNVHLDGRNLLPALTGESGEWPRRAFFARVDDGTPGAVRHGRFKAHFSTQDHHGLDAWLLGQTPRTAPLLIDLRADPFETAPVESSCRDDWLVRHLFVVGPTISIVADVMATFEDCPPRRESGRFTPRRWARGRPDPPPCRRGRRGGARRAPPRRGDRLRLLRSFKQDSPECDRFSPFPPQSPASPCRSSPIRCRPGTRARRSRR